MEQNKVMMFMATNGSKFSDRQKAIIMEKLKSMPDDNFIAIQTMSFKNPVVWLILYLFVPLFCIIDRLILGEVGLGVLKLITGGGFMIWAFIDIFNIMSRVRQDNYKKLEPFLMM